MVLPIGSHEHGALNSQGVNQARQRKWEESLLAYRRLLTLQPNNAKALQNFGKQPLAMLQAVGVKNIKDRHGVEFVLSVTEGFQPGPIDHEKATFRRHALNHVMR